MALDIAFHRFSFRYWDNAPRALADIELTVKAGTVCALLGPTNAGKTTLLQSVSGVLGSHQKHGSADGTIQIGEHVFDPLPHTVMFPTVGLTSQDPSSMVSGLRATVTEEVALTLESLGVPEVEALARTRTILERLGLSPLAGRDPFTLSGGELQRVALATILIAEPGILLMDEPCNSLDQRGRRRLGEIIISLKGSATVVLADHEIDFSLRVADSFFVLNEGRILFVGGKREFIKSLPQFSDILPVDDWVRSLESVAISPLSKRFFLRMGIS